jgi:zinc and cadmium transporter
MDNRAVIGWIALVVMIDGAVALVGGLLSERVLRRWRPALLGFATSTLLVSGSVDILPEAIGHLGALAVVWTVCAAVALGLFERMTARRHQHTAGPVSPVALLGSDALHNFGDGMAIAAAFLVSPQVGLYTSVAVILHELPEELADYAILRGAGVSRRSALAGLAIVQLTAGLGAAASLVASHWLVGARGLVLALAAGMFLYIALVDLLPEVIRARSRSAWVAFGIGAVFVLLLQ